MDGASQLEAIFLAALGKPAAERTAYLDAACSGDAALRERLERMIAAQLHTAAFRTPADDSQATTAHLDPPPAERPGARIGPYKLLQPLGEGGMGVVYMAEQTRPVQRMVALKIIKPGMDSRQVIARFEAERQALALMDHPNIARVLDAGTTEEGRPYFVMELVKGTPLTEYCDAHRLTPRARLELFAHVCRAVHHAHQKGVIHRDLKPSNILAAEFDGRPVPKVIDFGVAKAVGQRLTDQTLFTQYGQLVGTFEYMSPEQARLNQLDVDTRSDVYSLGVVLYELLAGSTPFDRARLQAAAFDEILRIVREEEPPRPSTRLSSSDALPTIAANRHTDPARLNRLLRGELDWIVMKCLEKQRNRRYETAAGLAHDIENFLADAPVQACPPSASYRLFKMVRRHKLPVAAGLAVAAALVGGTVAATYFAVRAQRSAVTAEQSAAHARQEQRRANRAADDAARQRERAQRTLSRSLYDQARLMLQSNQLGRRWEALRLLQEADAVRRRLAPRTPAAGGIDAAPPTDAELRSTAVAALLVDDVRRVREIKLASFEAAFSGSRPAISADGWMAAGVSQFAPRGDGPARFGLQLLDVDKFQYSHEALRKIPDLPSCFALSADGKTLATGDESRARFAVRLWNMPHLQHKPRELAWPNFEPKELEDPGFHLAFDPSGRRLAAVRDSYSEVYFAVWDVARGAARVDRLEKADGAAGPAAFSPDGRYLAMHTGPKTVVLWDVDEHKPHRTLELPLRTPGDISFSPRDSLVALAVESVGGPHVILWDYAANIERGRISGSSATAVAFHPDGDRLAVGEPSGVGIYDVPGLERIQRIERVAANMFALRWTSDGRHLFCANMTGALQVWEASPDPPVRRTALEGEPFERLVLSRDGRWLAAEDAHGVRVFERASRRMKHALEDFETFAFDAAGERLALAGRAGRPVVLRDLSTGDELLRREANAEPGACAWPAFDARGNLLVGLGCASAGRVWNATTDQDVWIDPAHASYPIMRFSDDARLLVVASADVAKASSKVFVWDVPSGREVARFTHSGYAGHFRVSPDNLRIAVGATSLLETSTYKRPESDQPPGAQSNDNRSKPLATLTVEQLSGAGERWSAEFDARIVDASFSAEGRLACSTDDGLVSVWDVARGVELFRFKPPHKPDAAPATFTPDGQGLAWGAARRDGEQSQAVLEELDLGTLRREVAKLGFAP